MRLMKLLLVKASLYIVNKKRMKGEHLVSVST